MASPEAQAREKMGQFPVSAIEYAKIEAVKERIAGLRMLIVGTAIAGVFVSIFIFLVAEASQVASSLLGAQNGASVGGPFLWAVLAAIPFMLMCGYLSYRVNRHVDRLSRGKFEPRLILEED